MTPDGWWLIQRGVADDKAEATPMEGIGMQRQRPLEAEAVEHDLSSQRP